MVKVEIGSNDAGQRLDRFLRKYLKRAPLSAVYKIIRKDLKLNGKRAKEDTVLKEGDVLSLFIDEERLTELTKESAKRRAKRQFTIAYEDDDVLIVCKPWGLLTHGDSHEKKNTLMNQVCGYLQDKGEYDPAGEKTFTILGEWDNDPERGILSSKTKVAGNMLGKKVSESFMLPAADGSESEATIVGIKPLSAEIREWMKTPEGMNI